MNSYRCPECGTAINLLSRSTQEQFDELKAVNAELLEALEEAADDVQSWGDYATSYFQEKHDLAGNVARIRAAIANAQPPQGD